LAELEIQLDHMTKCNLCPKFNGNGFLIEEMVAIYIVILWFFKSRLCAWLH